VSDSGAIDACPVGTCSSIAIVYIESIAIVGFGLTAFFVIGEGGDAAISFDHLHQLIFGVVFHLGDGAIRVCAFDDVTVFVIDIARDAVSVFFRDDVAMLVVVKDLNDVSFTIFGGK
jgi:hypothetical protein